MLTISDASSKSREVSVQDYMLDYSDRAHIINGGNVFASGAETTNKTAASSTLNLVAKPDNASSV